MPKCSLRSFALLSLSLLAVSACGDDGAAGPDAAPIVLFDATPPDAAPPDAFVCGFTMCGAECVDTDTDPAHCGTCEHACSPAADCAAPDCQCPANFAPESPTFLFERMNTTTLPPDVLAIGAFIGTDAGAHAVLVISNPDTVPIGTDIDLSTVSGSPAFGLGYEASMTSVRAGYLAVSGTMNLTRSCDVGVAGSVTDASLVEVDFTTLTPIVGGCTLDHVTVSFDIGDPCDVGPDAGIPDAGPPDA